ncbi:hypothetical protein ACFFNY_21820 [Paenibacillus hodogayensis]|uniref:Phage tail tape measure protein n=1 Tax=Paenibacillus hodogayensis TaxID=279208 RepID=A0ABV5W0X9_9BACL
MATILDSLRLIEQLYRPLQQVRNAARQTEQTMGQLRKELNRPMALNLDTSRVAAQTSKMRERIEAQLKGMVVRVDIRLPTQLHSHFRQARDMVLALNAEIARLRVPRTFIASLLDALHQVRKLREELNKPMEPTIKVNRLNEQVQSIRQRLENQLKDIPVHLDVQIPKQLQSLLQSLYMLVDRLLRAIGHLNGSLKAAGALRGGAAGGDPASGAGGKKGAGWLSGLANGLRRIWGLGARNAQVMNQLKLPDSLLTDVSQLVQLQQQSIGEQQQMVKLLKEMGDGAGKAEKASGGWLDKMRGVVGQYATLQNAMKLINATIVGAAKDDGMKAQFVARTGNKDVGGAMYDKFRSEAVKAGADVEQTLKGSLSFFSVTQNSRQISELNRMARQMAAFDLKGGGIEEAAEALRGAMTGDMDGLTEKYAIPPSSVNGDELENLGRSGNMDGFLQAFDKLLEASQMGKQAFATVQETAGRQFDKLSGHLKSSFSNAGQAALQALLPLLTMLNDAFESGKFQPFFNALSLGLSWVAEGLKFVWEAANAAFTAVAQGWSSFQPFLIAAATVLVPFLIAGLWAMVSPILAQAAAWLAAAWPVLLLIAIFGAFLFVLQSWGVTTEQIVGTIIGIFFMLGARINNIIASAWNEFAMFAEFLVNLFIDPVYAVQKLFFDLKMMFLDSLYNMAKGVEGFAGSFISNIVGAVNMALDGLNNLLEIIGKVTGKDFGKIELLDTSNPRAMSEGLKKAMDLLEQQKPTSTKQTLSIPRMELIDASTAYNSGYSAGGKLLGALDKLKLPAMPGNGDALAGWDATHNGIPNLKQIDKVGEIGKIGDTVDISSEDLKLMRDLADLSSIQNFVTLTPTVQVTTGDIHQPTDVDAVIRGIEMAMVREISNSAQGVYG